MYIGIPKEHGEYVSQFKTHPMFEAFILKEIAYGFIVHICLQA